MGTPDWIAALGVLGTWFIFIAAIWGEKIRSLMFQPELRVTLENPHGEYTTETVFRDPPQSDYTRPARYYRLIASNARRWPVAPDVRILITRLEALDPSGVPRPVWTGELPLLWLHGQVYPASRDLGRATQVDFVVVAQDLEVSENQHQLHFILAIVPNNFQRSYYSKMRVWVTVIATSNETDSPPVRLELAWDGEWDAGETEMARHFVIRPT
jgi:hypothetical protein